jgi:hypothetical protein
VRLRRRQWRCQNPRDFAEERAATVTGHGGGCCRRARRVAVCLSSGEKEWGKKGERGSSVARGQKEGGRGGWPASRGDTWREGVGRGWRVFGSRTMRTEWFRAALSEAAAHAHDEGGLANRGGRRGAMTRRGCD